MNVKTIQHCSGLLYGNNLGNPVHHMVHGRVVLSVLGPVCF